METVIFMNIIVLVIIIFNSDKHNLVLL